MTTEANNPPRNNSEEFGKRILAAVPHIYPYLKHRLYIAESTGVIPRNMYKPNGLLDDAILDLYEESDDLVDDMKLRLRLFALVDKRLDELYEKESFHKDTMSTSVILRNELQTLEEKFFMDADEDTVMSEDLDDISYHQHDYDKNVVLYDDAQKNIIQTLELTDSLRILDKNERLILNKIYTWLPKKTSNILDLYVFGKMSVEEIAEIKQVRKEEIQQLMLAVRKSFRKNLG